MTRTDQQILFTALGFTAVVLQGGREDDGSRRAQEFARLIEEFCRATLPEVFAPTDHIVESPQPDIAIDTMIERFKAELQDKGEARLPQDRAILLRFYDRLQLRQTQRQQQVFYTTAPDDLIANRVLALIDDELASEEEEI